jgi:hypothetical protein
MARVDPLAVLVHRFVEGEALFHERFLFVFRHGFPNRFVRVTKAKEFHVYRPD